MQHGHVTGTKRERRNATEQARLLALAQQITQDHQQLTLAELLQRISAKVR